MTTVTQTQTQTQAQTRAPKAPTLPTAGARRSWQVVAELARPQRWLAFAAAAVFVGEALSGLVGPLALGRIVDAVGEHRGQDAVVGAAAVLLAAALVQAVLTSLGVALTAQVGETVLARLRERVVARVLSLPSQRVEQAGAGELAARIGDDASVVAQAVRTVLPAVTGAALTILFTVFGLAALDWRFALAGLCAVPIQAGTLRWYLRRSGFVYAEQRIAAGERSRQILESVSGAETVRAFLLAEEHTERITARSTAAMDLALRAVALRSRFSGRLNGAEFTGLSLILAAGYWLVRSGGAGVGDATAAALLFVRLFDPVNILLGMAATVQEAAAGLTRLVGAAEPDPAEPATGEPHFAQSAPGGMPSGRHVAEQLPANGRGSAEAGSVPNVAEPCAGGRSAVGGLPVGDQPVLAERGFASEGLVPDPAGQLPVAEGDVGKVAPGAGTEDAHAAGTGSGSGTPSDAAAQPAAHVDVRGIRHDYRPGHPVLHGVDLRIARGEHVTLVGASGAGKSTLARIVAGVHPPTSGWVAMAPPRADGRPSVVLLDQDTHVFSGTVADNLLLADPGAEEAELREALRRAGALGWVEALPGGLDAPLGAGGIEPTPVQGQQLALARLALADPPVAVLDESAAEAGSEGARTLEAATREVLRGRTALVVAHRLTQAADADRVIVMEDGRVVEEGTHEALVAADGRYTRLWSAWSAAHT